MTMGFRSRPSSPYMAGSTPRVQKHQEAIEEAKRRMAQAAAVGSTYIVSSPPREVADLQLGGKNYRELP